MVANPTVGRNMKSVLEKIHPSYRKAIVKKIRYILEPIRIGNVSDIKDVRDIYVIIGQAEHRRRLLNDVREMIRDAWGTSLPVRVKELNSLLENILKQIDLAHQMADSWLHHKGK